MKSHSTPGRRGFTLVELLVVIVIVASLAALALTLGPRMMAKAKATEALQNIRQIGPALTTYATDHAMKLPAIYGPSQDSDGTVADRQWNEALLISQYPSVKADQFRTKAWWNSNKSFLRNPMFKEGGNRSWTPLNPGFGLNRMLAENIRLNQGTTSDITDPLNYEVPLAALPEPDRTPLVASYDNWNFRFDGVELGQLKMKKENNLMVDEKIPVLFVDGHVEQVPPNEYASRKLAEMPAGDGSSTGN